MKNCSILDIQQIFTTWNNPKGNADTERVMRTIKEDIVWPYDWSSPFDFQEAFSKWMIDYNTDLAHQSLSFKTPAQMMIDFHKKEMPLLPGSDSLILA